MSRCGLLYGDTHCSRLLKEETESASAVEAGSWFHSGMVLKTVEFQRGDDFPWALGLSSLTGLALPLGFLEDLIRSTDSGVMLTPLLSILKNNVKRRLRRRSASGCHLRSLRSWVTLTVPYCPRAHRAAFLWIFSNESESCFSLGSHIIEQYSNCDLMRLKYAVSRHLFGLPRRFWGMNPSLW